MTELLDRSKHPPQHCKKNENHDVNMLGPARRISQALQQKIAHQRKAAWVEELMLDPNSPVISKPSTPTNPQNLRAPFEKKGKQP